MISISTITDKLKARADKALKLEIENVFINGVDAYLRDGGCYSISVPTGNDGKLPVPWNRLTELLKEKCFEVASPKRRQAEIDRFMEDVTELGEQYEELESSKLKNWRRDD